MFHCPPSVLHFGKPGEGITLEPGMIFTIEPMINAGGYATKILSDGWTAVTRDRSLSAQFEHSIGITEDGAEIFTHFHDLFDVSDISSNGREVISLDRSAMRS